MISTINFERGGEHLELGVYSKIFTDVRESRLVDASHWTPRNYIVKWGYMDFIFYDYYMKRKELIA